MTWSQVRIVLAMSILLVSARPVGSQQLARADSGIERLESRPASSLWHHVRANILHRARCSFGGLRSCQALVLPSPFVAVTLRECRLNSASRDRELSPSHW